MAALLAALAMVSPFSIDTFFPSFRAIAADLGVATWHVQQTLTRSEEHTSELQSPI